MCSGSVTKGRWLLPEMAGCHLLLIGASRASTEPWAHPSTECAYVVADRLAARIGDTTHDVAAGESITFDPNQPHLYRNDTGSSVEFLVSVTPSSP